MDYANAESQSTIGSDAPPVYSRPESANMYKMIKMVSFTLLAMTAILGSFVLMSIYIQSNARGCSCGLGELRSESRDGPYFEPLTALSSDDSDKMVKRLPIRIQMDGEAGDLMRKNRNGNVDCKVERKTATQIIASEPKMLMTPYGNITTDPRLIHLTGEKVVFSCSTKDKDNPVKRSKSGRKFSSIIDLTKDGKEVESSKTARNKRDVQNHQSECACDCAC